MKASGIQLAVILSISGIFLCCSEKNENPSPKPEEIIAWEKTINFRKEITSIHSLSVKSDEGFLVSGGIHYNDNNFSHGIVISLNSSRDTTWCRQIDIEGFNQCEVFYALEISPEEIVITGLCRLNFTGTVRYVLWLDANGNKTDQLLLPELPEYGIYDGKLFLLDNGNIYLASSLSLITDLSQASHILRTDQITEEGMVTGERQYDNVNCTLDRMSQMENGNFLITGTTFPGGIADNIEIVFILTDPSGEIIHRKQFGTESWDVGESVCTDFEGGYMVSGSITYSNTPVIYPLSSSAEVSPFVSVADTIYSYGTLLKKAQEGYLMFVESFDRLYFVRLDADLRVKYTIWEEFSPFSPYPTMSMHITLLKDGSFAYLYLNETGYVIVKTIPV